MAWYFLEQITDSLHKYHKKHIDIDEALLEVIPKVRWYTAVLGNDKDYITQLVEYNAKYKGNSKATTVIFLVVRIFMLFTQFDNDFSSYYRDTDKGKFFTKLFFEGFFHVLFLHDNYDESIEYIEKLIKILQIDLF